MACSRLVSFVYVALRILGCLPVATNASFLNGFWPLTSGQKQLTDNIPNVAEMQRYDGKRVAIIGAGAAGSSSAYYMRQYLQSSSYLINTPVNITIFETNPYIGGRSTIVNAYDDPNYPVELGASIFVAVNYNLMNASKELGLNVSAVSGASTRAREEATDVLGVFDGHSLTFTYPEGKWWSLAKIIWRYGPMAPWRTQKLTESTVGKFLKMYEAPLFPFSSLSEVVEQAGLLSATAVTGEQYLSANSIEGRFTTELIQASTRVNYGQNLGLIHGLETMVCMAAEGANSVEGGNWRIFSGMVNASGADARLSTTVTTLTRSGLQWSVTSKSDVAGEKAETYDTVIIAAPYQYTNLVVDPPLQNTPDEIPYATLHVTLFASSRRLDPVAFGLKSDQLAPQIILTTLNASEQADPSFRQGKGINGVGSVGFFSISTLRAIKRPSGKIEYLYKIFSPQEFTDDHIRAILGKKEDGSQVTTWLYRHIWQAYPYEAPRVTFEESRLAADLWYTAGMESFISTMETNSLMGMNIARLVVDEWEQQKKAQRPFEETPEPGERSSRSLGDDPELRVKAKL